MNIHKKIAHWADEFSTDAFGEMLAIICKFRSSPKNKSNSEFKKKSSSGHLFRLRIARFPVGNGYILCPPKGAER